MIRDLLQDWVEYVFGGGMFSIAQDILNINPSTGSYKTIWNVVAGVYDNVCVPIGMGLVLIYFMVNLIERSMQQQQLDVEQVIKMLLKLVIGLYFIEHGMELMAQIYSLGLSFLNSIVETDIAPSYICASCGEKYTEFIERCHCGGLLSGVFGETSGNAIAESAWTELTGEKWEGDWNAFETVSKALPIVLQLIFPYLLSWILQLVCLFVCFFRLIEFYILTCAAPIAMSDFFTEGTHSNGWRFVKNYIAMALQLGVIMLAIVVFNGIVIAFLPKTGFNDLVSPASGMGKATYFILIYLATEVACAAVMLKSRSIAKEIVGVN